MDIWRGPKGRADNGGQIKNGGAAFTREYPGDAPWGHTMIQGLKYRKTIVAGVNSRIYAKGKMIARYLDLQLREISAKVRSLK